MCRFSLLVVGGGHPPLSLRSPPDRPPPPPTESVQPFSTVFGRHDKFLKEKINTASNLQQLYHNSINNNNNKDKRKEDGGVLQVRRRWCPTNSPICVWCGEVNAKQFSENKNATENPQFFYTKCLIGNRREAARQDAEPSRRSRKQP